MRKLPAALAGLTLVMTLASPAWAAETQTRHQHRYSGQSDTRDGATARGDKTEHDDGSILF